MTYDADGFMLSANSKTKPCYGGGFTVVNERQELIIQHIFPDTYPRRWTNNEAELWAVAAAVEKAEDGDTIRSDSELMVKWWIPAGKCRARPDLNVLCYRTRQMLRQKHLHLVWVPRHDNLAGLYNEQHHP